MNMADFNARQRLQKQVDQKRRSETAESMHNYKSTGTSSSSMSLWNANDMKLTQIKKEQRLKQKETAEQLRIHHGSVVDVKLAQYKKEQREKEKETAELNAHPHSANTLKESSDVKLAQIKKQDRQQKTHTESYLHSYNKKV